MLQKENGFNVKSVWRKTSAEMSEAVNYLLGFETGSTSNNWHYLSYCIIIIAIQHNLLCYSSVFEGRSSENTIENSVCKSLFSKKTGARNYVVLIFFILDSA